MSELPLIVDTPDGPMAEGASAELLSELLVAFEVELRNQGVPVDEYLLPGMPADQVRELFASAGLVAPDEAVVWYGWHAGRVWSLPTDNVLPRFQFDSLQGAINLRAKLLPTYEGTEPWQMNPEWIELLGSHPQLSIRAVGDPAQCPLVRCTDGEIAWGTQPDDTDHQVVSLCTPVTWWIGFLRDGSYTWVPERNKWHGGTMYEESIRHGQTRYFG